VCPQAELKGALTELGIDTRGCIEMNDLVTLAGEHLVLAATSGDVETVKRLFPKTDPFWSQRETGLTPLMAAARGGSMECVKAFAWDPAMRIDDDYDYDLAQFCHALMPLIKAVDANGDTAVAHAILAGQRDIVNELIGFEQLHFNSMSCVGRSAEVTDEHFGKPLRHEVQLKANDLFLAAAQEGYTPLVDSNSAFGFIIDAPRMAEAINLAEKAGHSDFAKECKELYLH